MWASDTAKKVLSVFGYVQVQGVLKQNTEAWRGLFFAMLGVLGVILIIFAILLVNSALEKKKQMNQTAKLNLIRILGYLVLALSTGGVAPSL